MCAFCHQKADVRSHEPAVVLATKFMREEMLG